MSRFHCEIERKGLGPFASYFVRDAWSSSGITVKRGKKIYRRGKEAEGNSELKLRRGDHLLLAGTEIVVEITPF